MSGKDIIRRIWSCGAYLEVWDTGRMDCRGQSVLGYRLKVSGAVVFEGEDFAGSPLHADDSDETAGALLSFLTLKPGDTDREYFSGYTPEQMAFCESSICEELAFEAMILKGEVKP